MILKDRNTEDYDSSKKTEFFLPGKHNLPEMATVSSRDGAK